MQPLEEPAGVRPGKRVADISGNRLDGTFSQAVVGNTVYVVCLS
jgi:hypothetical protein